MPAEYNDDEEVLGGVHLRAQIGRCERMLGA